MAPPRRILLATDLSARSDRATDRAAQLAGEHQAQLVLLHVLEPNEEPSSTTRPPLWARLETPPPDQEAINPRLVELARRQLVAQLGPAGDRTEIRIDSGDPAAQVLQAAEADNIDLLVTGVARNEFLGRFTLGKTVDRVLRNTPAPILIVNNRPLAPYRTVAVAVDFSPASRVALLHALAMFPALRLLVFHAYDTPYQSLLGGSPVDGSARLAAIARTGAFLDEVIGAGQERNRLVIVVDQGDPAAALNMMARNGGLELVVLGSSPRGPLMRALIGSVAERIVATLPCDALVVPSK